MHDDIFVTTHSAVVLGLPRNSALLCTEGMVLINEHLSCFHFPPHYFSLCNPVPYYSDQDLRMKLLFSSLALL